MQIRKRAAKNCQRLSALSRQVEQKLAHSWGTRFASIGGVGNPKSEPIGVPVLKPRRPLHDEWGIYDPEQAGLQVIIRKLMAPPDNDLDDDDQQDERQADY